MMTSASITACAVSTTRKPASSAVARLDEPGRSPTRTSNPESWRFCACAWPWLPKPSTAILSPVSAEASVSFS